MDPKKINHTLKFIRQLENQSGEKKMSRIYAFRFASEFHQLNEEEKRILGNMLMIGSADR